jgi:uncharacterized membrane protein
MTRETYQSEPTRAEPAQRSAFEERLTDFANRLVIGIARHWLALFNTAWGLYILLPLLAPVFMQLGLTTPARLVYGVYSFLCHQLPDHSYFLFGTLGAPHLHELEATGMPAGLDILSQRRYVGNELAGFKVALCQRDLAIYGSVLAAGLIFALVRDRLRPPSIKLYLLLLVPMAVDGITQMFGLRESDWFLRSLTGGLFGAASVWLAYPYVDDAMRDVIAVEERRKAAPPPDRP